MKIILKSKDRKNSRKYCKFPIKTQVGASWGGDRIYIYIYSPPALRHTEMHLLVPRYPHSHRATDPEIQKIQKSKKSNFLQDSVDVKSFGFLDFWIFGVLDVWIFGWLYSGSLDLWISGHQELYFRVP